MIWQSKSSGVVTLPFLPVESKSSGGSMPNLAVMVYVWFASLMLHSALPFCHPPNLAASREELPQLRTALGLRSAARHGDPQGDLAGLRAARQMEGLLSC